MTARAGTLLLVLAGAVLYGGWLNHLSLTDPDEVFYSQTAREMLQHKSLVTPILFGQPQFEKPPLFYWLLIAALGVAGPIPFAARLVPSLAGLAGVAITWLFCRRVFRGDVAWIAALILATSTLYFALSAVVLTDIVLSVLVMAAFYAFYLWILEGRDWTLYVFGVAAALAVLTKGPVAIVILLGATTLFLLLGPDRGRLRRFVLHPWVIVFAAIAVPWYASVLGRHGRAFVSEFIVHDNIDRILYPEHQNFDHWWFYPATIALGLFPWTFDLGSAYRRFKEDPRAHRFFLTWLAVTFTVFEIARSKLASYVLPLWPSLVVPLALGLAAAAEDRARRVAPASLNLLAGLALLAAPSLVSGDPAALMTSGIAWGVRLMGAALVTAATLDALRHTREAIAAKAAGFAIMTTLVAIGLPPGTDRAFASAYVEDIVRREHYDGEPILTDRHYARGVYFHSGNPVVVMDHNRQPFWSPHPIPIVSTPEEIDRLFSGRDHVLCLLKDVEAQEIDRMFQGRRRSRVLAADGHKVVVMSDAMAPLERTATVGPPSGPPGNDPRPEAVGPRETGAAGTFPW